MSGYPLQHICPHTAYAIVALRLPLHTDKLSYCFIWGNFVLGWDIYKQISSLLDEKLLKHTLMSKHTPMKQKAPPEWHEKQSVYCPPLPRLTFSLSTKPHQVFFAFLRTQISKFSLDVAFTDTQLFLFEKKLSFNQLHVSWVKEAKLRPPGFHTVCEK